MEAGETKIGFWNKKNKLKFIIFLLIDIVFLAVCFFEVVKPSFDFGGLAIFNPKGTIALHERNLIITATLIMLAVVIPVFFFLFFIVWKYRADKKSEQYSPNMQSNLFIGALLWAIPATIIFIIAILNWETTHSLDPYKAIASNKKPITIQVVALQWRWLFIYPEQNIATINFIEFPENTPVVFNLTADAPMNSFWIPQLGGQMYAMAGMNTKLNLMASTIGEFNGSAAEINGSGFAGMKFIAKSTTETDFNSWVKSVQSSNNILSFNEYNKLSQANENGERVLYSSVEQDLYSKIMMKFMMPTNQIEKNNLAPRMDSSMPGMNMENSN